MTAQAPTPARRQRRTPETVVPRCYRLYQVPSVINLSRPAVTKLIASGALPSFTVGRARFVSVEAIDAWIADHLAASAR